MPASVLYLIEYGTQLVLVGKYDNMVPLMMISDLADACPLSQCETLVHCIENYLFSILERSANTFDGNMTPKLTLLSCCKRLLRRMSKIENTVLCGKILLVLTYALPMFDRSGVNINGAFNLDNETVFESEPTNESAIDPAFYKRFWSLQQIFKNPSLAYQDMNQFKNLAMEVLQQFSGHTILEHVQDDATMQVTESSKGEEVFIPKYLTNSKMLPLQFKDSTFRKQIIIQVLVFLQHVEKEKKQTVCYYNQITMN